MIFCFIEENRKINSDLNEFLFLHFLFLKRKKNIESHWKKWDVDGQKREKART